MRFCGSESTSSSRKLLATLGTSKGTMNRHVLKIPRKEPHELTNAQQKASGNFLIDAQQSTWWSFLEKSSGFPKVSKLCHNFCWVEYRWDATLRICAKWLRCRCTFLIWATASSLWSFTYSLPSFGQPKERTITTWWCPSSPCTLDSR